MQTHPAAPEFASPTVRCVLELLANHKECEWIEFKENNSDPEMIWRLISALSNSALIAAKPFGFAVWGVKDHSREIVGTTFDPRNHQHGRLLLHLANNLDPNPDPVFDDLTIRGNRLCLLRVPAASGRPVRYKGEAYLRIDESVTQAKSHPTHEARLFQLLNQTPWETRPASQHHEPMQVLGLLNFQRFFELTTQPIPTSEHEAHRKLESEGIVRSEVGSSAITNLGAILFATDLASFAHLGFKKLRVVVYAGKDRAQIARQREFDQGYAACFRDVIEWITAQLPGNEHIGRVFRESVPMFPPEALREIVANALIHQDFSIAGARPLVEIFDGRIEIYNPGRPLVEPVRFLDSAPRSRNSAIAFLMRRMNICEELGSGIDRVLRAVEMFQLPAPRFESDNDGVRVVMYAHLDYTHMTSDDKVRAVYQHAGLRHVCGEGPMTNATLRRRFGMSEAQQSSLSKVIAQAVKEGLIKRHPPESTSKKHAQYLPFWA